ncbi:MAG: hypothetical protein LBF84_02725 [Holosporales bacterium]|nr:hypothetical protein [Holosporales bacterium]
MLSKIALAYHLAICSNELLGSVTWLIRGPGSADMLAAVAKSSGEESLCVGCFFGGCVMFVTNCNGGSNSKVVFTRSSFVGKLIKPVVPFCDAKPAKAAVSMADQHRDGREAEGLEKNAVSAVVLDGQQIRGEILGLTPGVSETDGPGPGTEIQENQGNQKNTDGPGFGTEIQENQGNQKNTDGPGFGIEIRENQGNQENTDGPGFGTEIQENQGNQKNTDGPGFGTEIQENQGNQEVVPSGLSFAPKVLPSEIRPEIRMVSQHVNVLTPDIPQKVSRNHIQSRPNFGPVITPRMTECLENRATGPPESYSIYSSYHATAYKQQYSK